MLLAAICAALTFKLPFYTGNVKVGAYGHEMRFLRAYPTYLNGTSGSIWILIVTIALIAGIFWNMFNYRKRSQQLWVTIALIVLSLVNILLYWLASGAPDFLEGSLSLTAVFVLAIPVCLFLAAKGIRKDEKLVKSSDRLR